MRDPKGVASLFGVTSSEGQSRPGMDHRRPDAMLRPLSPGPSSECSPRTWEESLVHGDMREPRLGEESG